MGESGFVAVLVVDLHFSEAGSLKSKRKELSSLKAGLRTRLGAAVAETEFQDLWQRSRLTVSLTAGSLTGLSSEVDKVERWLESRCPDGVYVERIFASVEDLQNMAMPSAPREG